jgi:hypothetical protein
MGGWSQKDTMPAEWVQDPTQKAVLSRLFETHQKGSHTKENHFHDNEGAESNQDANKIR